MKNRIPEPQPHWSTPKVFHDKLVEQWGELYDPCPINHIITPENDGLNISNPWGEINFVNPPYSLKEKSAFVLRAIDEWFNNGNISIILLPVSTSTKLYHHHIKPHAHDIDFLFGRLKFEGIGKLKVDGVTQKCHVNPGLGINPIPDTEHLPKVYNSGTFDSMVIQFGQL